MRLLIKGNLEAAISAASERDIEFTDFQENTPWNETIVDVSDRDDLLLDVVRWYCEPHSEAPFPDGTLLYYSEKRA